MKLLKVSPSPHIKNNTNTATVMRDVLIALLPALVWACWYFGLRALTLTLISVGTCVLSEWLFCKATKRENSIRDMSAVVTGVLLAFCLPITAPLWLPVIGGAFSIVIVKMLFGGIGRNFLNPALAGRVFLFLSFPTYMAGNNAFPATAVARKLSFFAPTVTVDGVSSSTVLAQMPAEDFTGNLAKMFYGDMAGCIGEVSKLLLLVGFLYLLIRKVISWQIPVCFVSTFFLLVFLFPQSGTGMEAMTYAMAELLSGGLFLAAIFMATDYSTSPMTSMGKIVFGVLCGALTVFFRYFGSYPEGVSFAVLVMNCFVYYLDKAFLPKPFGGVRNEKK